MITTVGKSVIKKFFGRQLNQIGTHLAFGVGNATAVLGDVTLNFEAFRIPVASTFFDSDSDRLIFKGSIPPGQIAKVYEIGLVYDLAAGDGSVSVPLFDTTGSVWTGGTIVTTNARVGSDNIKIDVAANGTIMASVDDLGADLSTFVSTDAVAASFTADANTSSVRVRLGSDSSNYVEFLYNSPAVGYNTMRALISSGTTTGTPDLTAINYVAARVSAKASGDTSVYFDGLRFEDNGVDDPESNLLVARFVPGSPVDIDNDLVSDVEYSLVITV